jgi:F0F1-type ATP synthase delta subunit
MNDILKLITTSKDKADLINFLEDLGNKIFDPSLNYSEFIESKSPEKFRSFLKQHFADELINVQNEPILAKIKELKRLIQTLPHVTLTLANDPDDRSIDMVRNKLFENDDKPALIEFVKDPNLIGGAIIESNGYIFEHSFRNYFEKRREAKNGF